MYFTVGHCCLFINKCSPLLTIVVGNDLEILNKNMLRTLRQEWMYVREKFQTCNPVLSFEIIALRETNENVVNDDMRSWLPATRF